MDFNNLITILVPIILALITSSGFWLFIESRIKKSSYQTQLLIGLAHDRIVYLGMSYIHRGWITKDEYENLDTYLYKPYKALKGNGSVERIMKEIDKLPIRESTYKPNPRRRKTDVSE